MTRRPDPRKLRRVLRAVGERRAGAGDRWRAVAARALSVAPSIPPRAWRYGFGLGDDMRDAFSLGAEPGGGVHGLATAAASASALYVRHNGGRFRRRAMLEAGALTRDALLVDRGA